MLLLLLFITVFSYNLHAQDTDNLKDYYFPYQDLFEPKVYQYVDKNDPLNTLYWWLETKVYQGDTIFATRVFDAYGYVREQYHEKITATGSELITYSLIIKKTSISTQIVHNKVFSWNQSPEESIKWSARYDSPFGNESIRKSRQFLDKIPTSKTFHKQAYSCLAFKETFRHSILDSKGAATYDFYQTSHYAKSIGLLSFNRIIEDKVFDYHLEDILSVDKWKKLRLIIKNKPQSNKRT